MTTFDFKYTPTWEPHETTTALRVQARIEALDSMDNDLVSMIELETADIKASYDSYLRMSGAFFASLGAAEKKALAMAPQNADCRGEVLLLLLGLKPSVLFAYGTAPAFAARIAAGLVEPWLAAIPPAARDRHALRKIEADFVEPAKGVNFKHGYVLSDTGALRRREVDDAFFAPEAYTPALLMSQIGRALGYPSKHGAKRNSRVNFVVDGGGDDLRAVRRDSDLVEFLVEGPSEVPRAARYYLKCAEAAAPFASLRFALCGRVLTRDRVEALARDEHVDETAAAIAKANRTRAPVFDRE